MPYKPDHNAIRKAMEDLQTSIMQEFDKIGRELEVHSGGAKIPAPISGSGPAPEPHEPPAPPSEHIFTPEGFGKIATGGTGKTPYVVTTLLDSGPGSLRDAVSAGGRNVSFSVGGDINLVSPLVFRGPDITVDCLTALAPGITLKGRGITIDGGRNAHNIVLRGIRSRDVVIGGDGLSIYNAQKVMIDRCSFWGWGDGGIDITEGSKDVTVQWTMIGGGIPTHNLPMLMYARINRISILNNLFFKGESRNPRVDWQTGGAFTLPETTADVRNNLIWKYRWVAMSLAGPSKTNIVGNFFYANPATNTMPDGEIVKETTTVQVFTSDNYSHDGRNPNADGNVAQPFLVLAPPTTYTGKQAAHRVKDNAGPRGPNFNLDAIDQAMIDDISSLPDFGT